MTTLYEEAAAVRAVVANVPHNIDGKRWSALRSLYADEVETHCSSLFDGEPHKQSAGALVAGWRGVLERVRSI